MRPVAILTGPQTHLDHLGVLSALLCIPLVVTDRDTQECAQTFYPDLNAEFQDLETLSLKHLAEHYDAIFESGKFFAAELRPFLELLFRKKMRFIFCPHGNSDKGSSLKTHADQDISLVYGSHLHTLLKKSGAAAKISHIVRTGNYRLPYYLHHKKFYDTLAQERIFNHFATDKPILLYAPTWSDQENPTSFFLATDKLIQELSPTYNLLIKLHPLLIEDYPAHVFALAARYENHPAAFFLTHFPPIYPLLARCSLYIGDYSSIGYDFLAFDKPLYFIHPKARTTPSPLQTCGIEIPLNTTISLAKFLDETQEASNNLAPQRKKVYQYAFGKELSKEALRTTLFNLLSM